VEGHVSATARQRYGREVYLTHHADRALRGVVADDLVDRADVESLLANRSRDHDVELAGLEFLDDLDLLRLLAVRMGETEVSANLAIARGGEESPGRLNLETLATFGIGALTDE
jgi:hypothetical protein